MRALVTGAGGTVGSVLCRRLRAHGHQATPWDRTAVEPDDYIAMEAYVRAAKPDVLFHLAIASESTGRPNEGWLIGEHWPSELAWIARQHQIRFVFASTVMVFTDDAEGPFTPATEPDATEGYGGQKRRAEARVRHQCPDAVIARLGWQIGEMGEGGNHMLAHLERQHATEGHIAASTRWLPACSFLPDTADALIRLATAPAGTYGLDSNRGWSYHTIVRALNARHGVRWTVEATDDFVYDQRMQDPRITLPPLSDHLALPTLDPQAAASASSTDASSNVV